MMILSRKPGESIVMFGCPAFSTMAGEVPSSSVPVGGGGTSGSGDGGPPVCPALATPPGPLAGARGRSGSNRRRDRPRFGIE
jgi:hypothetical protein